MTRYKPPSFPPLGLLTHLPFLAAYLYHMSLRTEPAASSPKVLALSVNLARTFPGIAILNLVISFGSSLESRNASTCSARIFIFEGMYTLLDFPPLATLKVSAKIESTAALTAFFALVSSAFAPPNSIFAL